jgi:hypothetical protein
LTTFLAAVSSVALILSIIHETVYYYVIGLEFMALLDAIDYFKQALYWLPLIVVISLLYTLTFAFGADRPLDQTASAGDSYSVENALRQRARSQKTFIIIAPLVLTICAGVLIYIYGSFLAGLMATPVAIVVAYLLTRVLAIQVWSILGASLFTVVFVISLSIGFGYSEAKIGLRKASANLQVRLSDPDVEQSVVILRLFGKGILVRHPSTGIIEFIPTDRIKAISTLQK